ncbi:MAG: hypothetical protein IPQ04_03710 [Saprospiraceae bacterium]|nr:hypothetical protein [Saprospiraceae bacterium]
MKKNMKNLKIEAMTQLAASKICGGANNQTENEKGVQSRTRVIEQDVPFLDYK